MQLTYAGPGESLSGFEYSAENERLGVLFGGSSFVDTYNVRGELTTWPQAPGTWGMQHGWYANGTQIVEPYDGGNTAFWWDDRMGVQAAQFPPSSLASWEYDNAGRLLAEQMKGTTTRAYDAENHTLTTDTNSSGLNPLLDNSIDWGPNGHPILIGGSTSGTPSQFDTLHWNGDTVLFTTNSAGQLDDIKIGAEGDILPLDPGYAGLTFYDRDPSGGVMGCHNSTGATYAGISDVYTHPMNSSKISGSTAISPCSTDARWRGYIQQTGSPVMPTSIMWWSSPTTLSAGGATELTFPAPPVGQGGVLGMPRTDGYTDGTDIIQGVRTYDSNAGTWTTPDVYEGDVDDPASQKSYMWNDNDPESYADPSGYNSYLYYDANCGDSCDAAPPTDTGTKTPQDSNDSKGPTQQSNGSAAIATETLAQDGGGQQKGTGGSYGENSYSDRIAAAARQYEASGASTRGLYGAPTGNECVAALQKVLEIAVLSQMLGSNGRILLGVPAFVQALLSSGYAQVATPVAGDIVDLSGVHVGVYLGGNEMVSNSSTPGTFTWKDTPEHENATAAKHDGVPIGPITYYHHEP